MLGMSSTRRGIYLIVTPVEKEGGWETTVAFSGFKTCINEMKRANAREFYRASEWWDVVGQPILEAHLNEDENRMWRIIDTYKWELDKVREFVKETV